MNKNQPVLPCEQRWFGTNTKLINWPGWNKNKESIGELWLGFLNYYTRVFDWENNGASKNSNAVLKNTKWTKREDPYKKNTLAKHISKDRNFSSIIFKLYN
jgi:hypothetical protein